MSRQPRRQRGHIPVVLYVVDEEAEYPRLRGAVQELGSKREGKVLFLKERPFALAGLGDRLGLAGGMQIGHRRLAENDDQHGDDCRHQQIRKVEGGVAGIDGSRFG